MFRHVNFCEGEGTSARYKKNMSREDIDLTFWLNWVVFHIIFAEGVGKHLHKHVACVCRELKNLEQLSILDICPFL